MQTQHAKSPCCQALVHHFGKRRRQCSSCKRTWRIRRKRRGRRSIQTSAKVLTQVLLEGCTLRYLAKRSPLALPAFRYRFRQALRRLARGPYPHPIPRGPLILLADGLWFYFRDKPWILYLTAVKPCWGILLFSWIPYCFPVGKA